MVLKNFHSGLVNGRISYHQRAKLRNSHHDSLYKWEPAKMESFFHMFDSCNQSDDSCNSVLYLESKYKRTISNSKLIEISYIHVYMHCN